MNNNKKGLILMSVLVMMLIIGNGSVMAATGDPITVVENLSDFIFSLIRAIGIILLGFGRHVSQKPRSVSESKRISDPCRRNHHRIRKGDPESYSRRLISTYVR